MKAACIFQNVLSMTSKSLYCASDLVNDIECRTPGSHHSPLKNLISLRVLDKLIILIDLLDYNCVLSKI